MIALQQSHLAESAEILDILNKIEFEGLFYSHDKLAHLQVTKILAASLTGHGVINIAGRLALEEVPCGDVVSWWPGMSGNFRFNFNSISTSTSTFLITLCHFIFFLLCNCGKTMSNNSLMVIALMFGRDDLLGIFLVFFSNKIGLEFLHRKKYWLLFSIKRF